MDINRNLNTIGMKCFFDYFYELKAGNASSFFPSNFTEKSKKSRQSHASCIFNNNLQLAALQMCVDSKRLDKSTIEKAKSILIEETTRI